MPKKSKTDWAKLKQEYLAGDIEEVSEFLRRALGETKARNGYAERQTKGWREERAELKQKATEAVKKKIVSSTTVNTEKLLKMKENVLILVGNRLAAQKENLSANELKVLWEILKTEVGEPTSVAKTQNETKLTGLQQLKGLDVEL
jgi:hypothetical protein